MRPEKPRHRSRALLEQENNQEHLITTVLSVLGVEAADFSPDLPLVDYGLDSISAARLATSLRPRVSTSQVQLLNGVTWTELLKTIPQSEDENIGSRGEDRSAQDEETMVEVILRNLGITRADLSLNQPLVSYGMDSLGAARLASELREYIPVTQVQLLGNMTSEDILTRYRGETSAAPYGTSVPETNDVVVQLSSGEGVPLIVLHDVTGSVTTFLRLRPHVTSPLWAIQAPRGRSVDNIPALAAFYYTCVKEKVPTGPYRLAAFSASSVLSVALAKCFEDAGDVLLGHTFVDHFPAFWVRLATLTRAGDDAIREIMTNSVVEMLTHDGTTGAAQAAEIRAAQTGQAHSEHSAELMRVFSGMVGATLRFLEERGGGDFGAALKPTMEWVSTLRTPLTLIVATNGIATTLPQEMREEWKDLGVQHALQPVAVHRIDAGHFHVLGERRTAEILQGIESS